MSANHKREPYSACEGLGDAQAVLQRFTRSGRAQRAKRPVNFNNIFEVAALELRGRSASDPVTHDTIGAWLCRMKERGAGHCTPLQGAAEGLHVLVLDARAVADLWAAVGEHRASVASYAQLQSELAQLRKLRGEVAGEGEAD